MFAKKKPKRQDEIDEELEDLQRRVRCERRSISIKPKRTKEKEDDLDGELEALKRKLSGPKS